MKQVNKQKKNTLIKSLTMIMIVVISIFFYTVWDNNRVILVEQTVKIKGLPDVFENYHILVLSDLHGKRFGSQQQKLLNLIDGIDYDAVFIAGDMQTSDNSGFDPLTEIIAGLHKEVPVYFVGGNWGPYDSDLITGEVLEAGKTLESLGLTLVTRPIKLEKAEDHIWFVPDFSYSSAQKWIEVSNAELAKTTEILATFYYSHTLEYQSMLLKTINDIPDEDAIIGLMHIPLSKDSLDTLNDNPPYDLVIAGHFHGGQIRIPLFGALYVPDKSSKWGGFFPDNHFISGLYAGKAAQQYISRGLGANDMVPILNFRLFDTPEADLLILQKR